MSARLVSAIVLTYNEEKKIESCLKSLVWADEIVIVDAMSTDATHSICHQPNAPWASKLKWNQRAWSGFREQRNHSLGLATHEWVLVVDADEVCSLELATKIRDLLECPAEPEFDAYKVHRREFFQGKAIFYGMWNPSYQDRFFKKTGVSYVNEIHEYPQFRSEPGAIHEPLLHYADVTIERYLEKLNHYTTIEAQDRYDQGQRTSPFKMIAAFPAHALKSYFYYQAYRDGVHGLVISLLEGISRVVRQLKIWQLMQNKKRGIH